MVIENLEIVARGGTLSLRHGTLMGHGTRRARAGPRMVIPRYGLSRRQATDWRPGALDSPTVSSRTTISPDFAASLVITHNS